VVHAIGNGVIAPRLVKRVEPQMPEECRKNRVTGSLFIFEGVIDERGNVIDVKPSVRPDISPPCPAMTEAYRQAISQWKYEPATLNGRPVRVYLTITVTIHLT
jgi:outer membrane biosynthesis protein TonB